MIFMAGTQILWSAYVLAYDHSQAYSPDLAASKFLQPLVRDGAKIAVTYLDEPLIHSWDAVGMLPYFDHNIYMNWPNSFGLISPKPLNRVISGLPPSSFTALSRSASE